jgi:hypothetical protein
MALSLTCHNKDCGKVLTADTEDELVRLGQQHSQEHGHHDAPPADHVLARIRKHNPPSAGEPQPPERSKAVALDYTTQIASIRGFGRVEKVYVGSRWVGMVYRQRHPPAEVDDLWMAYYQGGHAAASRQDALAQVLDHAAANPSFEIPD